MPVDYHTLHRQLLTQFQPPSHLPSPSSPEASGSRFAAPTPKADPALTSAISDLRLHPALEAALHLLNSDLPSAHFLLRKMQNPPALEAMYLHAILHKLEGDYENARAWYRDIAGSDVEKHVLGAGMGGIRGRRGSGEVVVDDGGKKKWAGKGDVYSGGGKFGGSVTGRDEDWEEGLGMRDVKEELEKVVGWCERKWGTGEWRDARGEYVKPDEKIRGMMEGMVSGGDGPRMWAETGKAGVGH